MIISMYFTYINGQGFIWKSWAGIGWFFVVRNCPMPFRMSSIFKYHQWPPVMITKNIPTYFLIAPSGVMPSLLRTTILEYSRLLKGFQPLKSSLFSHSVQVPNFVGLSLLSCRFNLFVKPHESEALKI